MRIAQMILNVIRERGQQGLPLERVSIDCFITLIWMPRAYAKLYSKTGVMTPGTTSETVDGMSLEKIRALI